MARIKVEQVHDGLHPSEVVVAINTTDGMKYADIARRSIIEGMIDIGYPVGMDSQRYIVELPRETGDGYWRVWMDQNDVFF